MPSFKNKKSIKFAGAIAALTAASLTFTTSAMAVQPTVGLGYAKSFAVLAGSGITNTGATTVSGTAGANLGSSPTGTFTGDTLVTTTGTKYTAVDAVVDAAKDSLVTAYDDAAGRTPFNSVSVDRGGQTLTQGVYNSASWLGLTETLTLDAEGDPNAVFIFQAGSTLTTANTTATFHGSLLARNGAVTLDTNTIVNDACSTVPPTEDGGTLPNTDTVDWLIPVSIGAGLVAVGAVVYIFRRKRS